MRLRLRASCLEHLEHLELILWSLARLVPETLVLEFAQHAQRPAKAELGELGELGSEGLGQRLWFGGEN